MSAMPASRTRTGRDRRDRTTVVVALGGVAAALLVVLALFYYVHDRRQALATARSVREALTAHRFDLARARIDRWAESRSGDVEPDYFRAELEVALDHPGKALDAIRKAHQRGYPEEPLEVLSAVLQARAGQFEAAELVLRRALGSSSGPKPEVAEGLARVYLGTFRLAEASRALDHWMLVAPDDARPYLWRNQVDERIGSDPVVLIRNFRAALQRNPSLDQARIGLAERLRKLHRVDEAAAEYAALLTRNPKSLEGLVGAGQTALMKGDLSASIRDFNDALAIDPKNPSALRELAMIDLRNGRFDRARDRLKAAVDVAPDDVEVRYQYAQALKSAGDHARAAEETAAAARLRKEQQNIDEIRKALVQRPADAGLRYEAAKWLIEHGHEKEGLEWTELILRQSPHHPGTCRLLADYHAKKGNVGLANYYRLAASQ